MAVKTACPISRKKFRDAVKPLSVTINGQTMDVDPKEFATGSLGWYLGGKVAVTIDGVRCQVQVGLSMTLVGSKELPAS